MAEIILEPTVSSKVIPLTVRPTDVDRTYTGQLVTNKQFNTADTDAWFRFTLDGLGATTGSFKLTLINLQDKSVFNHSGLTFATNPFYYKLDSSSDETKNEIRHAGRWVGQLVVTLANGDSATRKFIFDIEGHILDGAVVQTILLEDYNALIATINTSKDLLAQYNVDYAALLVDLAAAETARTATYNQLVADQQANIDAFDVALDTGIVAANLATKLQTFEATNNSRLLSTEQQLAEVVQIINVKKYGAKGDGVTDDTAAIQACIDLATANGGGRIYFPRGEYIVSGALRNTSQANAQLILPNLTYGNSEQISIEFYGEIPPPAIAYVIKNYTILPKKHVVIRSTLNAGVGGCMLGAWGGGAANFTNLLVKMENISFRLPENPVLTALDLSRVASIDLDNVVADSSNYNIRQLVEPTTPTSHGIKLPARYNGAHTRLGSVDVLGFYNGYRFGEHSNGQQVASWGCYNGFVFETADHASSFLRLNAHHNKNNVVFLGKHYVNVVELNLEHVNDPLIWYNTVNDIDDASNYGQGSISYSVVAAFLGQQGVNQVFTKNGAGNLIVKAMFNKGKFWNSATLENSWVKATGYGTPTVQFKKDAEDRVSIRGAVQSGTAGSTILTLPVGYRPPVAIIFPCVSAGKIGTIEIYTSGVVKPSLELGNTIISLEVINFYIS